MSRRHDARNTDAATAAVPPDGEQLSALLIQAINECYEAIDAGIVPDRESLLAKYSSIARELAPCLDSLDFVAAVAPQLDQPSGSNLGETLGHAPTDRALGDFRIFREIGRGGMGVVYEAEQISIGRRVALKVLPFAAMLDKHQLNRFKNEARAAGTLDHPHIVSVFAVGEERGVHYYAMRLVQGQSLAEMLEELRVKAGRARGESNREPSVTPGIHVDPTADTARVAQAALSTHSPFDVHEHCRRIASLGIQAAHALAHAHENGILHRDVKPANLLVDGDGKLYVADFGLARIQTDTDLSVTGDVLGTLRYMSPEQARGQSTLLDGRTDIYSLGASMYELLTLTPAIQGQERADLIRSVLDAEPVAPRKLNAAIPKDLETIVVKSIAKEPEERYSTMRDLAEDLQRFLDCEPIHARRPRVSYLVSRWVRRHAYLVAIVVGALLLIMSGALLAWKLEGRQRVLAENNLDVALDFVAKIIEPAMTALQHNIDSEFANDQIIMPAIQELEGLRRASSDPRIISALSKLHDVYAHHQDRLGLDSTEHARIAVDLAKEYLATSPDDHWAKRGLASAYETLCVSECTRGAWAAAAGAGAAAMELNQQVNCYQEPTHPVWTQGRYSLCLRKSCKIEDAVLHSRKSLEFLRPRETSSEILADSLAPRVWHAFTLLERADWDEADKIVEKALQIVETWSNDHTSRRPMNGEWPARVHTAAASVRNGQYSADDAIRHAEQCNTILDLNRSVSTDTVYLVRNRAEGHEQLSDSYALKREWASAEFHARESIRIWDTLGDLFGLNDAARGRFRLAHILVVRGQAEEARRQLEMARDRMRQLVQQFPNEFFYVRQLLMLLTLTPSPEVRDVELAATLAELDSYPDSQILSRYRALAYSSAGKHEAAKKCTQNITLRPPGGDTIDALIACIVYARAGDFGAAQVHYERAKEAKKRGEPVHFLDCGPLVIEQLLQQADEILSRETTNGA